MKDLQLPLPAWVWWIMAEKISKVSLMKCGMFFHNNVKIGFFVSIWEGTVHLGVNASNYILMLLASFGCLLCKYESC